MLFDNRDDMENAIVVVEDNTFQKRDTFGGDLLVQNQGSIVENPHTNPAVSYLASLGSKKSRQSMTSILNIVARQLGSFSLSACNWEYMRRHHVQALVAQLVDSGKAPSTINNYLAALKGVAMEAWTMGLISTDEYQHIKHVKSVRGYRIPKGRALSRAEISRLIGVCEEDTTAKGVRDAAMISILIGCGLRRAELVSLDYESILLRDQGLRIIGKGNKERMSFMPNSTWSRVEYWINEIRGDVEGPLFTRVRRFDDVTYDRLTDQAVYHILEERRKEAGLEEFSPHDIRRTFASTLLDGGQDIVTVKDAMGHSSIATTQKYDRRGDDRLKKASELLDF